MRICHVCSNYDGFFSHFMETQISKGIDPRVFHFRAKEKGRPGVTSDYVDVRLNYSNFHRPFFYLKENKVLKDFFGIYKKEQFDLIHAHTLFSNGYVALKAKEKWGTPYIVAVRNTDINIFFKYRLNLRKLGIKILKEAEKIIFISPVYRDFMFSNYIPESLSGEFKQKSVVLPNGLDPFFVENKAESKQFNKEEAIQLLTVGHVCKNKNQLTVCKSVEKLNRMGIKAEYTVIGKVLDEKVYKKLSEYNFVKYIPFLDKENLISEFQKADIYIMPSYTETFGLTYVEAMSQGLPVIYTRGQGFDGQIPEGRVGYAVNCEDEEEIKNKVIDIINNYDELSSNCLELCDQFNWQDITDRYVEIYRLLQLNK